MFWMLNTIGWVTFYWHWKHLGIYGKATSQFNESSTYLMGWLRVTTSGCTLLRRSTATRPGMNNLSVWSWMFLFGHLVWATGFMFLISWRLLAELIETGLGAQAHPLLLVRWKDKPGYVHRPRSSGWSSSLHGWLCPCLRAFLIALNCW